MNDGARAPRSDGVQNRQRVLDAATVAVARDGLKVPLAVVAEEAGVGIGTLYRHFPDRDALLAGVVLQSLRLVVDVLTAAAEESLTAVDALRAYFHRMISERDRLILPLRGGPPITGAEATALRARIGTTIDGLLRRGRDEGTIRPEIRSRDIVVMATMLAQPLPSIDDWDAAARRTAGIYLAGLAPPARGVPLVG
jgi:AcrR family transcriptional regulator